MIKKVKRCIKNIQITKHLKLNEKLNKSVSLKVNL